MRPVLVLALVTLSAAAGVATASGPKAGSLYADQIIVTTSDGIEWTGAMIDSVLAEYPKAVREAFKRTGLAWQGQRWGP